MNDLIFTIATTADELDQVERLNHETFTSEIPQHAPRPDRRLRDKFHNENTYLICKQGSDVLGMLALRGNRPFSLDGKLADLDALLPEHTFPCELRLLSVREHRRKGRVTAGLLALAGKTLVEWGHDLALVSGTTRELDLYHSMGFVDFGPVVGNTDAPYQPMYLTYDTFMASLRPRFVRLFPDMFAEPVNFLPGPPTLSSPVRRALAAPSVHHRSREGRNLLSTTQAMLCSVTGADAVQILPGSGTLANDMVAATLAQRGRPGVVLSNGEFGERLVDHATRAGLKFTSLREQWGAPIDLDAVEEHVRQHPKCSWLWCVHGETSTGILNPLEELLALGARYDVAICADAVSTLGVTPVDLGQCAFATGASAKGLGAVPGLALVFHSKEVALSGTPPRALDLARSIDEGGVPCTVSSKLLAALRTGVQQLDIARRSREIRIANLWLRARLPSLGVRVVSRTADSFDAVLSIELPRPLDSREVGDRLAAAGYLVGFESRYLVDRNWIQICFMSEGATAEVSSLFTALRGVTEHPLKRLRQRGTPVERPTAAARDGVR